MERTTHCKNIILICFLAFTVQVHAQQIAETDKQSAIQSIAGQIAVHYFDVGKGGQIASQLQTDYHQGEFSKANDWKEFDILVTQALDKYSQDKHLYVRYDPETVAVLRGKANSEGRQSRLNVHASNAPNAGFEETSILSGNVGYMRISEMNLSEATLPLLGAAMEKVRDTRALIIDLRDNEGGHSNVGPVLESYFFPARQPLLQYEDRDGRKRIDSTMDRIEGKRYEQPVYILVNRKTASAAEAFAFTMQQYKRASIVGERSAGAAYLNEWFVVDDNNYVSVSTAAPSMPGKHQSWQHRGLLPDIRSKKSDPVAELVARIGQH